MTPKSILIAEEINGQENTYKLCEKCSDAFMLDHLQSGGTNPLMTLLEKIFNKSPKEAIIEKRKKPLSQTSTAMERIDKVYRATQAQLVRASDAEEFEKASKIRAKLDVLTPLKEEAAKLMKEKDDAVKKGDYLKAAQLRDKIIEISRRFT